MIESNAHSSRHYDDVTTTGGTASGISGGANSFGSSTLDDGTVKYVDLVSFKTQHCTM